MFGRKRLIRSAVQLRGRIEGHQYRACAATTHMRDQMLDLVKSPAAVPIAFLCGVLADRLRNPGMHLISRIASAGMTLVSVIRLERALRHL